jgi:hypothetical protein
MSYLSLQKSSGPPKGLGPTFELHSGQSKLILRPSRAGYLLAELQAAEVRARREVLADEFELTAFLEALRVPAWLGERWLESPRGQLHLSAANEGSGNVRLIAQLRDTDDPDPWQVELTFRLRQSDLGPIIERARAFISALPRANGDGS